MPVRLAAIALCVALGASATHAQGFPSKTITVVVPAAPGA